MQKCGSSYSESCDRAYCFPLKGGGGEVGAGAGYPKQSMRKCRCLLSAVLTGNNIHKRHGQSNTQHKHFTVITMTAEQRDC